MEKKIYTKDAMYLDELADEIFNGSWLWHSETTRARYQDIPHYLGFYKAKPLEITISIEDTKNIVFRCDNWCDDEDLKKLIVVFYMKKGIYPSFVKSQNVSSLIVQLEKL